MKKEEIIEKLKGLQRYEYTDRYPDKNGELVFYTDIEELINELEKPELFCETVKHIND